MSLIYNGTTITDVTYNGTSLTTLIFNGTTVWQKIVTPSTVDVLVVAGGGSSGTGDSLGSWTVGGGGGAGGMCEQSGRAISAGTTYTVIVGAGGASRSKSPYSTTGLPGSNSIFDTITSLGGGAGGGQDGSTYQNSIDGGSGGGAFVDEGAGMPGGAAKQGNSGGATGYGTKGAGYPGGGYTYDGAPGGGAGGLGTGRANSITGSSVTYAKGGGYDGLAGQANTGNGGAIQSSLYGITGGSGVVVVRYPNTYSAATVTGSPTYTNTGGYHVYKFTGSGTIRW